MMQRFFRTSDDALYEQVRALLDAAWLHVPPTTCIDPAAVAPHDALGRILLAVRPEFCEYEAAASMLPQLLSSGAVEEITEAEYQAAVQTPDPLQG
jgi:hypothetical protein